MNESTLWLALGWTMLHSLWSGLVLGVLVALGRLALRGARPAVRYGFLCAALALLAALPVVLFVFAPGTPARAAVDSGTPSLLFGLAEAPAGSWTRALIPWLPWVWTIGSTLYLVLLLRGLAGTSLLRRRACAALERVELSARCRSLASELGVARRVLVRVCDEVASPLVVGIARPLIVLPTAVLARCTPEQIEMVLLHELAHVRRWDNLVQLAQRVVQAVLFYQPAVWLVSSWIDLEREHCCDAVVLERTRRPRVYAQTLLALADAQRGAPTLALSMARRPLLARIERILRTQEPTGMQAKTTALVLTAALLLGGATLAPLTTAEAGPQRGARAPYVRLVQEAPVAPECPRAPHPAGLPGGTDCSACHTTPVEGPSPHVPDVFEVHADLPASAQCSDCHMTATAPQSAPRVAPSVDLERLRARERELRRLLGEVERLRRELEALRGEVSAPPPAESRYWLRTTAPEADYLLRKEPAPTRKRYFLDTRLPGAPTEALEWSGRGQLRHTPGAPLPDSSSPRAPGLPGGDTPPERLRTRYAPNPLAPEAAPEPQLRVRGTRSLYPTPTLAPQGLPGMPRPRRETLYMKQPPAAAPPQSPPDTPVPILSDLPLLGDLFEPAPEPAPAPRAEPAPVPRGLLPR